MNREDIIKMDDMYWTTEDIPAYKYLKQSHQNEMDNILPHLSGNKVAVQAGAHCGFVIKELLPHFENIYTFEPDNTMFACLCMNIPDKNVFKMQACLGNTHDMVSMGDNEMHPHSGARYVNGKGNIPSFKIDDLGLEACDLLMLDLEGAEYNALQGAYNTIQLFHPLLCIERYWMIRTLKLPESVLDEFLNRLGYKEVARSGESDHIYKYQG